MLTMSSGVHMRYTTRNDDGMSTNPPYRALALLLFGIPMATACDDKGGFITDEEYEERLGWGDNDGDGYNGDEDDCNDDDASINPSATEVCDGADNNCDGEIDEGVTTPWYADSDGDGWGSSVTIDGCGDPGDDFVPIDGDCDDGDDQIHPHATEVCDGQDNDCDGDIDDEDDSLEDESAATWYTDADSDGYGDPDSGQLHCEQPDGSVDNANDCDDDNILSYNGASEICDTEDNDCDGDIDEDLPEWYSFHDNDGDGEGDPLDPHYGCDTPVGYELAPSDCDDTDPGATSSSPNGAFIDSDGDGDYNCWDPSVYSFDAVWAEGSAEDWLIDNGDDTYSPISELNLCGLTDSPFGSADGDEDGLGVWSVDANGFIIESSNDACHAITMEVGVLEGVSIDVEYTFNDTGGGGIWIAVQTDNGYIVTALRYPYITTPPLGIFYFDTVTETVTEFYEDNHADFAVSSGVLSVTFYDDVMEATIGGASLTIDDAGEILSNSLTINPNVIAVGSWDNDSDLEIEAIGISNLDGWTYDTVSGTYTR